MIIFRLLAHFLIDYFIQSCIWVHGFSYLFWIHIRIFSLISMLLIFFCLDKLLSSCKFLPLVLSFNKYLYETLPLEILLVVIILRCNSYVNNFIISLSGVHCYCCWFWIFFNYHFANLARISYSNCFFYIYFEFAFHHVWLLAASIIK